MSAQAARRLTVLGIPVDVVDPEGAVLRARQLWRGARPGAPALVLTPNPELIMQAAADEELAAAARSADLALPDGVGVVWALRRQGVPGPRRVPGVEFMHELLAMAASSGAGVFLLGARAEVVAEAAERARVLHPGLRVVGWQDGYFGAAGERDVLARIAGSDAELLLVGMGAPHQERFLYRHRHELGPVLLAMAVGGSFDVLSGRTRRAPRGVRRLGLEWLWRLARQPNRWRRQLALPRFALAVLRRGSGTGRRRKV